MQQAETPLEMGNRFNLTSPRIPRTGEGMKPAPFEYQAPATLREAIDLGAVRWAGLPIRRRIRPLTPPEAP